MQTDVPSTILMEAPGEAEYAKLPGGNDGQSIDCQMPVL